MACARGIAAIIAAVAIGPAALGETICVPDDYPTIQAAIDAAVDGDEVCVAPGTYNEAIDFIGKAVRLYSTSGPEVTFIDATGLYRTVVRCENGERPDTVLEGFTITGGTGDFDCVGWDCSHFGGGMSVQDSSPTITECTFFANSVQDSDEFITAGRGAGLSVQNGAPAIIGCTFTANVGEGDAIGGGLHGDFGSEPLVIGTTFIGNAAGTGGAISATRSLLIDCTFVDNKAWRGGAIEVSMGSVVGCSFIANRADYSGGAIYGWTDATTRVSGSLFCDNFPNHIVGDWIDEGDNDLCPLCDESAGTEVLVPDHYSTIQAAINDACDGAEILVSPGTYHETINFSGKAITVRSTHGPEVTTIDAEWTFHGVVFSNAEGPGSILDGFTIQHGRSPWDGGGAHLYYSSPTVVNCLFVDNDSGFGGGLYSYMGSPTVSGCLFEGNTAYGGGGVLANTAFGGHPTFIGCSFVENESVKDGGGLDCGRGSTLVDCAFLRNTANRHGGGARLGGVTVINCSFIQNVAVRDGGGVRIRGGSVLTDCMFFGNAAYSRGGGVFTTDENTLVNCTLVGNRGEYGGGIYGVFPPAVIANSVLWDHTPFRAISGSATVMYSNIEGGHPGIGNIVVDPLFVDPDNSDFRLQSTSPCIDAGHNWAVPRDTLDIDEDGNTDELIPFDLDGNPRFNADEIDFDPGCGVPVVVDMGAYEYQYDPVEEILFADVNGDGSVDISDLTIVLSTWGECDVDCCLADLDLDWEIGFTDLLSVLDNWS